MPQTMAAIPVAIDLRGLPEVQDVVALLRELAAGGPLLDYTGGACCYCGYDRAVFLASDHEPTCPWRRAVELTAAGVSTQGAPGPASFGPTSVVSSAPPATADRALVALDRPGPP